MQFDFIDTNDDILEGLFKCVLAYLIKQGNLRIKKCFEVMHYENKCSLLGW